MHQGGFMNLLIHDLSPEEWAGTGFSKEGWHIISDQGTIRPCTGCFSCWNRDPGKCVIRDGYENMGYLIHHADEIVVISRFTYGGFSGFIKNVFDRCLGYVLPQFEVIDGETHHQKRYAENKLFTFMFYGPELTEDEKHTARRYVRAVCTNIRGTVKDVIFIEQRKRKIRYPERKCTDGKTILINGSVRFQNGNSAVLAKELAQLLKQEPAVIPLVSYLSRMQDLYKETEETETIVFCVPLYVDGLPSQVIRFMEYLEKHYRGGSKKIYVLANMGLYESSQLASLFTAVRLWCAKMGFDYCGGLGVSAGELIGTLKKNVPFRLFPSRKIDQGMRRLAQAVNAGEVIDDIFAEPFAFPRSLYVKIANDNWNSLAKQNGIRPEDLYRQL